MGNVLLGVPNPLQTLEFVNDNTGWVSGCCGMFLKTTNAGVIWTEEIYLTPGFTIHSMKFINQNTGFTVGDAGYILRTTDGGTNWDSLNSNTHRDLRSVCFVNSDTGFAVGNNGTILKTINRGGQGVPIGIDENSNLTPQKYMMYQNYPNPFNPTSKIKYRISNQGNVKVSVFDALGRETAILVNERLNAGTYEVEFDAKNITGGIYFYQMIISDEYGAEVFRESKKMLLIK